MCKPVKQKCIYCLAIHKQGFFRLTFPARFFTALGHIWEILSQCDTAWRLESIPRLMLV